MTSTISGIRTRRVGLVLLSALGVLLSSALPASASLPDTSTPTLSLDRTIQTTPFVNLPTSMRDGEGSAYVPGDNSLWLADDNDDSIYEVDPGTGDLKRVINSAAFQNAPLKGGGPVAGPNRMEDFEAMAYDAVNDWLFVFSGPCCTSSNLPTAFRLTRQSGIFQVESYQPLASTADYTAAAWNPDPADGQLYVGHAQEIRSYDYELNTAGSPFSVTNLSGVLGFAFSSPGDTGGTDLFVTTNGEKLKRVDWATKTLVAGWTFDLLPFDVLDSRAVELINDQFYVLDGYDARPAGPLRFAVFVFDVLGPGPVAPVASFNASPMSGDAPLSVTFTDTSTNNPTEWLWNFGDGTPDSTLQDPTHVYDTVGNYTVTLTASNSAGSSSTTKQISVTQPGAPTASFTADPTSGNAPLTVAFTDTSTGTPTSWAWDFGDGATDLTQNPSHTYNAAGTYVVTLTVDNSVGPPDTSDPLTITVNVPPANLVGNPGFETDLSGWGTTGSGTGVTIAQVSPGHTGTYAARLFNGATGKRKCVLNDTPNWVTTTAAGTYTASIWVRGDVAGALIKINIKEMNGSTVVKSRVQNYTLTTSWQPITVSHAPLSPGSTSLDLQVFLPKAQTSAGTTCFYADDASILKS